MANPRLTRQIADARIGQERRARSLFQFRFALAFYYHRSQRHDHMISIQRLEANRRNALRSTGPRTEDGKQRSRANAVRHGLTAETVVGSLEDAEDYEAFEAAIIADYDAETAVARELVLRLASLLWRLRRANAMIQAGALRERPARRSLADANAR
jgi:hypothetical protein